MLRVIHCKQVNTIALLLFILAYLYSSTCAANPFNPSLFILYVNSPYIIHIKIGCLEMRIKRNES